MRNDGLQLLLAFTVLVTLSDSKTKKISLESILWGPGLENKAVLPVRFFYLQAVSKKGKNFTSSPGIDSFTVHIHGGPSNNERIRVHLNKLDRQDGTFIIRYRLYRTYPLLHIDVTNIDGSHVGRSPYVLRGSVRHEQCFCPEMDVKKWQHNMQCPEQELQVNRNLEMFRKKKMRWTDVVPAILERFPRGNFAHYAVIGNKVYQMTHGSIVGFKMFSEAIMLSMARKVRLPDMELLINLGDYPQETFSPNSLPVISWCGSEENADIVLPTYDVTESTLETLGRVTLDMMSVQGNTGPHWKDKISKGFWRGRDSRQERLDFVVMARANPDLFDAALTNFFFFPSDDEKYGPKVKHISFFDFFKFKYQINIDGTVAAYRLPYLLGGDSLVFKQDSPYYEHFYHELEPWEHYIPFNRNLSDLIEKVQWAIDHDDEAHQIARNGQAFARERLMPDKIFCYIQKVFEEYAKLFTDKPKIHEGMELLEQPSECECSSKIHDEL